MILNHFWFNEELFGLVFYNLFKTLWRSSLLNLWIWFRQVLRAKKFLYWIRIKRLPWTTYRIAMHYNGKNGKNFKAMSRGVKWQNQTTYRAFSYFSFLMVSQNFPQVLQKSWSDVTPNYNRKQYRLWQECFIPFIIICCSYIKKKWKFPVYWLNLE